MGSPVPGRSPSPLPARRLQPAADRLGPHVRLPGRSTVHRCHQADDPVVLAAVLVFGLLYVAPAAPHWSPAGQFAGKEAYSFVRNGMAPDIIGSRDYMRFVPLSTTMFFFILVNNLFGLVPFLQFAPFSRAGFAYALAAHDLGRLQRCRHPEARVLPLPQAPVGPAGVTGRSCRSWCRSSSCPT